MTEIANTLISPTSLNITNYNLLFTIYVENKVVVFLPNLKQTEKKEKVI